MKMTRPKRHSGHMSFAAPPFSTQGARRLLLAGLLCLFPLALAPPSACSDELLTDRPLREAPWPSAFIGNNRGYRISSSETLTELARSAQVGYAELCAANPQIDPWLPSDGATVILPGFRIVPDAVAPGITINLPEYRLYFVGKEAGEMRLRSYAVGIGAEGDETPLGQFKVREKLVKPTWQVPLKVRKARRLPKRVPPGPDNPLGEFWLGVTRNGVGIHGTNEPFGVGRRSSRGCIRLYPEDIGDLFARVPIGTPVTIIDQPFKLGVRDQTLFLEAHPRVRPGKIDPLTVVLQRIERLEWHGSIDWEKVHKVIEESTGRPTAIGYFTNSTLAATTPP